MIKDSSCCKLAARRAKCDWVDGLGWDLGISYQIQMVMNLRHPMKYTPTAPVASVQGRISRGIQRLPKILLKPAMPYHSTPCERPPLKRPYSCSGVAACIADGLRPSYYPLGYSMPYASGRSSEMSNLVFISHCPTMAQNVLISGRNQIIHNVNLYSIFSLRLLSEQTRPSLLLSVRNFPCQTYDIWGHNDMPCGRPAPGRPIGRPGSGLDKMA
jgi:hypothetical protein